MWWAVVAWRVGVVVVVAGFTHRGAFSLFVFLFSLAAGREGGRRRWRLYREGFEK
jgi:predicted MPP superfamily phosphohydrolase